MDYTTIGKHLREARLKKKLRQDEFAELVGLSANYYGAVERGEKIPSLETFIAIINALQISADLVLADVLSTGYRAKNSALNEKFTDLDEYERERIYAVIDTLLQFSKRK